MMATLWAGNDHRCGAITGEAAGDHKIVVKIADNGFEGKQSEQRREHEIAISYFFTLPAPL